MIDNNLFEWIKASITATSKTWTRTLYPGPGPWTQTLKNLDPEKRGKQLDMEKWLEDHIL